MQEMEAEALLAGLSAAASDGVLIGWVGVVHGVVHVLSLREAPVGVPDVGLVSRAFPVQATGSRCVTFVLEVGRGASAGHL